MSDAYTTARFMHGAVSWFDDDYIEKFVPGEIVRSMHETSNVEEANGFTWGFNKVFAGLQNEKPYICLASKYIGQGHSEIKCIFPPSIVIHQMHISS